MGISSLKSRLKQECNNVLAIYKKGSHLTRLHRKKEMHQLINLLVSDHKFISTLVNLDMATLKLIITTWRSNGIKESTILKKIAIIRAFYRASPYPLIIANNMTLGLSQPKQKDLDHMKIDIKHLLTTSVGNDVMRNILEFQIYFGLTKSESIRLADTHLLDDAALNISRDIAHNHRDRSIPIISAIQKNIIAKRKQLFKNKQSFLDTLNYQKIAVCYEAVLVFGDYTPKSPYQHLYIKTRLASLKKVDGDKRIDDQAIALLSRELGIASHYQIRRIIHGQ